MKSPQEKIDNENKFREILEKLARIANGDSHNTPPKYLAGELRYIASELDLLF